MSVTTIDHTDIAADANPVNGTSPTLQPPTNISTPKFLEKYLMTKANPVIANDKFLISLGEGALAAKLAHVEDFNSSVKFGKKRLPDKLDFEDTAILMMALYRWHSTHSETFK